MLYTYKAAGGDALGVYTFIILLYCCHAEVDCEEKSLCECFFFLF